LSAIVASCSGCGRTGNLFALDHVDMHDRDDREIKRHNFVRCSGCGVWQSLKRSAGGNWYLEPTPEAQLFGLQLTLTPIVTDESGHADRSGAARGLLVET
jgi:hypothetical protein